jgi:hypothetical protein
MIDAGASNEAAHIGGGMIILRRGVRCSFAPSMLANVLQSGGSGSPTADDVSVLVEKR